MAKQIFIFGSFILINLHLVFGQQIPVPDLKARVTDLTSTLTGQQISKLETKLANFESSKGSQVVVLLIPTTGEETIEQYSIRVADEWKIGRGAVDDGVIMLIALEDRKMRIEVGTGLEGAIPDIYANRIISNVMIPEFLSGSIFQGIDEGTDAVIHLINGEDLPAVTESTTEESGGRGSFVTMAAVFLIFFISIIQTVLSKIVGKTGSRIIATALSFFIGWILIGLFAGIFMSVIALIFSGVSSRNRRGGGGFFGGGYYGGGFSSGGGGFSGGGFSGGGGGFSGGGASGGW